MYDCSKEFLKFYQRHVVLPAEQQNHLRKKRRLNINRLKKGLEEYNEEIANEFEHMEELKEEEEVTNLVDQVTDEAIKLTFDGTEAHVTLPDDTEI